MTTTPPDRIPMSLGQVPAYIKKRYGTTVSRGSIHNWATKGRGGVKLRTCRKSPVNPTKVTTGEWLADFIAKTQ